ncbi:phage holin family protein [Yoonia sp. R2331]|uniref:phage holin family protein n=1 Tax=Yoonia sp. R2331 TaxID=3237238 RepID=UPI0034E5E8A9
MAKHPLQDTPSLLVESFRQFSSLVQGELKLARAEMSHIVSRAGVGLFLIALAMLLALVALNVLATAAVAQVAALGLSVGLAALSVGALLLFAAVGFALAGRSRLSASALTPDVTAESVRKDIQKIREASHV